MSEPRQWIRAIVMVGAVVSGGCAPMGEAPVSNPPGPEIGGPADGSGPRCAVQTGPRQPEARRVETPEVFRCHVEVTTRGDELRCSLAAPVEGALEVTLAHLIVSSVGGPDLDGLSLTREAPEAGVVIDPRDYPLEVTGVLRYDESLPASLTNVDFRPRLRIEGPAAGEAAARLPLDLVQLGVTTTASYAELGVQHDVPLGDQTLSVHAQLTLLGGRERTVWLPVEPLAETVAAVLTVGGTEDRPLEVEVPGRYWARDDDDEPLASAPRPRALSGSAPLVACTLETEGLSCAQGGPAGIETVAATVTVLRDEDGDGSLRPLEASPLDGPVEVRAGDEVRLEAAVRSELPLEGIDGSVPLQARFTVREPCEGSELALRLPFEIWEIQLEAEAGTGVSGSVPDEMVQLSPIWGDVRFAYRPSRSVYATSDEPDRLSLVVPSGAEALEATGTLLTAGEPRGQVTLRFTGSGRYLFRADGTLEGPRSEPSDPGVEDPGVDPGAEDPGVEDPSAGDPDRCGADGQPPCRDESGLRWCEDWHVVLDGLCAACGDPSKPACRDSAGYFCRDGSTPRNRRCE